MYYGDTNRFRVRTPTLSSYLFDCIVRLVDGETNRPLKEN